jgi:nucleoside permease NupC
MILKITLNDSLTVHKSVNEGYYWLEALHIFLNIVLPILIFVLALFVILKFYKTLKEICISLKDIRDSLNKDK